MNRDSKLIGRRELVIIALALSLAALAFLTGYQKGWEDHQERQRLSEADEVIAAQAQAPTVVPLRGRPTPPLPSGHPSVPQRDQRGHPSFDCRALKAPVPKAQGELTIAELLKQKSEAGAEREVTAMVIGAYFGILGTNWYHLCDEPQGQVLVVSSAQRTEAQSLVKARGALSFDYVLSDVYRFPIYMKGAQLSGAQVQDREEARPQGVIEL